MKNGLSIILPVYNEEKSIIDTANELLKLTSSSKENIEIIIVNDGSKDKTTSLLEQKLFNHQKITILNHQINKGYGAALKTGLKFAQFEYIAITDADSTYPNSRILEFYIKSNQDHLDMLIGERKYKNLDPVFRILAKWFLKKLAGYLTETIIPDLNSGFRIMKKSVVNKFIKILPNGFSFTSTITIAMLANNYNVKYEKIDHFQRTGKSKIKPIQDTTNFLILILRTVLFFRPLKIFVPLSGIMFLIGLTLIVFRIMTGEGFLVISTVLLIGAVQILAIGMLADLINRKPEL